MTEISVIKAQWTGFSGAPGLTQFAVDATTQTAVDAAKAAVESFFGSVKSLLPTTVSVQLLAGVDVFEHTTGALVDAYTITPAAAQVGGGTGPYVSAGGGRVEWKTGTIANGHRVSGRTFIVPMTTGCFHTDGNLNSTATGALTAAANGLLTYNTGAADGRFVVWGRPRTATASDPGRTATLGYITGMSVPQKMAVLRGRRD